MKLGMRLLPCPSLADVLIDNLVLFVVFTGFSQVERFLLTKLSTMFVCIHFFCEQFELGIRNLRLDSGEVG